VNNKVNKQTNEAVTGVHHQRGQNLKGQPLTFKEAQNIA
jgi:hypothetical protein